MDTIPGRTDSPTGRLPRLLAPALCLAVAAGCTVQRTDDAIGPAGEWEGVASTPGGPLAMEVELERAEEGWSGTFAVPSEAVRIPLAEADVRADSVILTITSTRILRGRLTADTIVGELELDGRPVPTLLARPGSPAAERMRADISRTVEATRAEPLEETSGSPARDGVDAAALERLVAEANAAHSHTLVVRQDGELVGAWHAGGERRRIEAMSVTKSILNLAVGRLVTTGRIESIDEPVHTFFPEWSEGDRARVTIRHLLNHTSGLASDRTTEAIYASDDFVRLALDSELTAEPGTEFFYNNNAVNLLAGVIGEAAGRRMDAYLREDLFARLGITDFDWSLDPAGNPHGMSGLQLYPEDLAKLGQLVLDDGMWQGERLIDASFLAESLRTGSELNDDAGLLWWLIRDGGEVVGYRADGYLGQYLVIYPGLDLVAVRMVESSPAYDAETDGFRDFPARVRALARAEGT